MFSLNPTFVELAISEDLLDRAREGDCEAFSEVCREHETRLLRQALTLCGNTALAEDLAQETLVEAWRCLRRYNGKCQFFTWLCAILLNRYRNAVRSRRALSLAVPAGEAEALADVPATEALPDQTAEARERAALVLRCIEALPPKHQQVIYLRFYVDHSLDGIAEALGCSVGTVKSQLWRALEKLRAMPALQERGAAEPGLQLL